MNELAASIPKRLFDGSTQQLRIAKIDNFLGEERRELVYGFLSGDGWKFGWKSNAKKDPYSFWHRHFAGNTRPDNYAEGGRERQYDCAAELSRAVPLLHRFWLDLERQVIPGHTVTRCYANGQPFGSEGSIHTDSTSSHSLTVIYYPNPQWHPNWGGETLFFNPDQTDIVSAIYPKPDRLVLFSGTIPHIARGVSRVCPALRITLMFKAELVSIELKYRDFLIEHLHADEVRHSGRDFYTHLSGTYDLLKAWGNPQSLCLAGLFHSIYGTWHFRHKAFPIERRDIIRGLIGEEAEFLAYVFCVTERPKELLAQVRSSKIMMTDHCVKEPLQLSRIQLNRLLEIEAANLIEQGGDVRGLLEQIAQADISVAAKMAIAAYLKK